MKLLLVLIAVGYVQAQAPVGYTKVADQDFIDAGPLTIIRQNLTSMQACADACTQDAQCQSFMLSSFCFLYQLRRCMTPPLHDSGFDALRGPIYEKTSPVQIPNGSRIETICGNYSGVVISSFTGNAPNGDNADADRAAFASNCSQLCSAQTGPACRSWRMLEMHENSPNIPIDLRCTLYADSIYDVDGDGRGYYSAAPGPCKRALSIYAINGAATSFPNCSRTAPTATAMVGSDNGGASAPSSGSWSSTDRPSSSQRMAMTTSPVVGADVSKNEGRVATSASAAAAAPVVALLGLLSMVLAMAL